VNTRGRVLQSGKSLSYYHIPEWSRKDPIQAPRPFQRRNINRKTHLQIAQEHAALKKKQLAQQKQHNEYRRIEVDDDGYYERNEHNITNKYNMEGEEEEEIPVGKPEDNRYLMDDGFDDDGDGEKTEENDNITWFLDREKSSTLPHQIKAEELSHHPSVPPSSPRRHVISSLPGHCVAPLPPVPPPSVSSSSPSSSHLPPTRTTPSCSSGLTSYDRALLEDHDDDERKSAKKIIKGNDGKHNSVWNRYNNSNQQYHVIPNNKCSTIRFS
jgi:hypothetical protein